VATDALVDVDDLHKSFDGKEVLKGISFQLFKGETLVVMGGSGSGKTVLLRHVAGLVRPDRGHVMVFGQRIDNLSEEHLLPIRRRMGYVFQGAALFDSLSVYENVAYPLREHTSLRERAIRERVVHFLSLVGLGDEVLPLLPSELSGGMRKRVGIARAVALRPRYILYDEPTTGLDPITSAVMDRLMQRTRDLGVTGVVVTHDMRTAFTVVDRIAMLYDGAIRQAGTVAEIQATTDPVVRQFIEGRPDEVEPPLRRSVP